MTKTKSFEVSIGNNTVTGILQPYTSVVECFDIDAMFYGKVKFDTKILSANNITIKWSDDLLQYTLDPSRILFIVDNDFVFFKGVEIDFENKTFKYIVDIKKPFSKITVLILKEHLPNNIFSFCFPKAFDYTIPFETSIIPISILHHLEFIGMIKPISSVIWFFWNVSLSDDDFEYQFLFEDLSEERW